jgi:hypothetical protein
MRKLILRDSSLHKWTITELKFDFGIARICVIPLYLVTAKLGLPFFRVTHCLTIRDISQKISLTAPLTTTIHTSIHSTNIQCLVQAKGSTRDGR